MKICKAFANGWSGNIKLFKIVQLGEFMLVLSIVGPPILPQISSIMDPIIHSFLKEFKNTGTLKIK